ncbi:MAG TPA: sulfite exporter TauE/SafE family protein, partial [Trebonia sp.]|nr:sulfite exporter TauE/SafE family protein [Trebonia sp.]
VGAILLLVLPAGAFKDIVPALIGIAVAMVLAQPWLARWMAARQLARAAARGGDVGRPGQSGEPGGPGGPGEPGPSAGGGAGTATAVSVLPVTGVAQRSEAIGGPVLWVLVFATGVYGGYFGAAQGVLLIGMLGIALGDTLQRVNAVKNVLAGLVNGVAAVVFIALAHVDWSVAGLIAAGSILGGQLGARIGRRLPPWGLRLLIVCVGAVALVKLLA